MPTIDIIEITDFDSDVESQASKNSHVEKTLSAPILSAPPKLSKLISKPDLLGIKKKASK